MAYIICEPCIGTKDSACVDVCPVDCIHPRKDEPEFATAEMLFIHPGRVYRLRRMRPRLPGRGDLRPRRDARQVEVLHRAKNAEYLPEDQEIRFLFPEESKLLICCKGCASRAAGSRASAASGPVSRGRRRRFGREQLHPPVQRDARGCVSNAARDPLPAKPLGKHRHFPVVQQYERGSAALPEVLNRAIDPLRRERCRNEAEACQCSRPDFHCAASSVRQRRGGERRRHIMRRVGISSFPLASLNTCGRDDSANPVK